MEYRDFPTPSISIIADKARENEYLSIAYAVHHTLFLLSIIAALNASPTHRRCIPFCIASRIVRLIYTYPNPAASIGNAYAAKSRQACTLSSEDTSMISGSRRIASW
jgi:hypothetical protein